MDNIKLDKLISKLTVFGVPALVFIVAYGSVTATGLAGGAAMTATLAALGPIGGMIGGLVTLGIIGILSQSIAEFSTDRIACALIRDFIRKGETFVELKEKISKFPISKSLKLKLFELIEKESKENT